jgi:hypothetical protein
VLRSAAIWTDVLAAAIRPSRITRVETAIAQSVRPMLAISGWLLAKRSYYRTQHDYTRFNYIGEWHSHPSFTPVPSRCDDNSMREIVQDPKVGANFVVLLIVKLHDGKELQASVHTYLPDGTKHASIVDYRS